MYSTSFKDKSFMLNYFWFPTEVLYDIFGDERKGLDEWKFALNFLGREHVLLSILSFLLRV